MTDPLHQKKRKRDLTSAADGQARRSRCSKLKAIECPICFTANRPSNMVTLTTCSCTYCKLCLREAFAVGLSPSCFPARCCGRPLDLAAFRKHLPAVLRRRYRSKAEEEALATPVYCANPECGAFISEKQHSEGFGSCGMCHKKTCVIHTCKRLKSDHLGIHSLCPEVIEDSSVTKVIDRKGWKRCPRCYCIVEKVRGCNDIRCICKAEWCYECGKLFKCGSGARCICRVLRPIESANEADNVVAFEEELPDLRDIFNLAEASAFGSVLDDTAEVVTQP